MAAAVQPPVPVDQVTVAVAAIPAVLRRAADMEKAVAAATNPIMDATATMAMAIKKFPGKKEITANTAALETAAFFTSRLTLPRSSGGWHGVTHAVSAARSSTIPPVFSRK